MPSMVGILSRAPAVDKKTVMFLSVCLSVCLSVYFLSRFGMTKFVITEALWSSIIFKTIIMVSLHRGKFVVVHLCSSFPIDPQNFSRGANFYQKLPFLGILGAVGHIFKAIAVKFGMRVWSWGSLPQAKYCKNRLRGYTPFRQIYTKNTNFGGCTPTFFNPQWRNLAWGCESETPSPSQIL